MKSIKVKGYTRLAYNPKKQKIEVKKGIRIKKTHLIAVTLLISLLPISFQYLNLKSEIGSISQQERINALKVINTQEQDLETDTSQLEPNKDFVSYNLRTKYIENEIIAFQAVNEACIYHGLDNNQCRLDLMGIIYAETRDFSNKLGDSNKSRGLFQIHKGYHPEITDEQANDPFFSAKWTLRRMIFKGYKTNRDYAIMSHNGTPNTKATLSYLETVNYYISL